MECEIGADIFARIWAGLMSGMEARAFVRPLGTGVGKSGVGLDGVGSRKFGDSWSLLSGVEALAAPGAISINQTVVRGSYRSKT